MDGSFVDSLMQKAKRRKARIAIGIRGGNQDIWAGLEKASDFANLVVVTDCIPAFCEQAGRVECLSSRDPEQTLVDLLVSGEAEGAVRGNVSASRTMKALSKGLGIDIRRMVLLRQGGHCFMLGPVGIDEGDRPSDRLELALESARFLRRLGVEPRVALLSGGRLEDMGRSKKVDQSLGEAELITRMAERAQISAVHRGILIETCIEDDVIIAPDGISGNLIFRTLMYLCQAQSLGAPVLTDKVVFVDSSRGRSEFSGPVALAGALAEAGLG